MSEIGAAETFDNCGQSMYQLVEELFPICRSITGDGVRQTLKMLTTPTEKILKKFITDPELLAFFDKLTGAYCDCDISETPAILAATMFIDNHIGGAYYPARSPQVLSSTLEKALEKYGGQTLYRVTVEEIFIEKGSAKGVRLADGTIIGAERIIANCTVWNL